MKRRIRKMETSWKSIFRFALAKKVNYYSSNINHEKKINETIKD